MIEPDYMLRLVRVIGPAFVAGFETDGKRVRAVAPILNALIGMTNDQAREHIRAKGWTASIITAQPVQPSIVQHTESFEVCRHGVRAFFYFDDDASRRAISGRPTRARAFEKAQAYLAS